MWNNKKQQKLFSLMSNLQTYYHFQLDFQKVDQHTGGKWFIHGTKRRKDNQLQSQYNCVVMSGIQFWPTHSPNQRSKIRKTLQYYDVIVTLSGCYSGSQVYFCTQLQSCPGLSNHVIIQTNMTKPFHLNLSSASIQELV